MAIIPKTYIRHFLKEIIDIVVIVLFVYILFVILRGFNEQQVKKHQDMLDKAEKKTQEKKEEDKND